MPEDSAKSPSPRRAPGDAAADPASGPAAHWWRTPRAAAALRAGAAAIPVAMVNGTAFIGQFAFLRQHVPWVFPGQVLIAVTIEIVAVYLAWHAHLAAMSNDSSGRLKAGAYSFAQVVGLMNYSHYAAPHWRPTVMSVLMYSMSALSPWLWGIHTRRASRDKLMGKGLIEEHAVRLGGTRWTWHPVRSVRASSWAAWHGVNDPALVIGKFSALYGAADEPLARRARGGALQEARAILAEDMACAESESHGAPPLAQAIAAPVRHPGAPAPVPPDGAPSAAQAIAALAHDDGAPAEPGDRPRLRRLRPLPFQPEPDPDDPAPWVSAAASLTAEPRITSSRGKRPSPEVVADVELQLAGMPDDSLPSVRAVALMLSPDSDQRRLAGRLIAARIAAGRQLASAPPQEAITGNGAPHQGAAQGMIAPPQGFQPGGNGAHG